MDRALLVERHAFLIRSRSVCSGPSSVSLFCCRPKDSCRLREHLHALAVVWHELAQRHARKKTSTDRKRRRCLRSEAWSSRRTPASAFGSSVASLGVSSRSTTDIYIYIYTWRGGSWGCDGRSLVRGGHSVVRRRRIAGSAREDGQGWMRPRALACTAHVRAIARAAAHRTSVGHTCLLWRVVRVKASSASNGSACPSRFPSREGFELPSMARLTRH